MTETIPARDRLRLVSGGQGQFMCPPGHPMHRYHLEAGPARNPNALMGLQHALDADTWGVTDSLRARVQKLYDEAELVMSEDWVRQVYGYFKNSYSPDGTDRNVSNAVFVKAGEPLPPATHHLGYLCVRKYFPDATPRLDLIEYSDGYGQRPCVKCGTSLQYEASADAWLPVKAVSYHPDYVSKHLDEVMACPEGGQHSKA